jgi:hypothetical protein
MQLKNDAQLLLHHARIYQMIPRQIHLVTMRDEISLEIIGKMCWKEIDAQLLKYCYKRCCKKHLNCVEM